MRNLSVTGLLAVGLLAACSGRASDTDTAPIWPDLILDQPAPDLGADASRDRGSPEGPVRDAPGRDGGDLSSTPWQVLQVAGGADLHDVACLPGGHVFVAGSGGTLLHHDPASPGSGLSPQVVGDPTAPVTSDLYTVTFADATYGAAAGKDWRIWETRDLGQTWPVAPQCSAFTFDTFYSLHLTSASSGFGAGIAVNNQGGGYKYYTGYSWVCGPVTYAGEVFYDVFRLGQGGWIVGDTAGKIYRTADGGSVWVGYPAGTTETLRAVTFHSSGSPGIAVGEMGTIVVSTDGTGSIWTKVASPVGADLLGVTMVDALVGWAVGKAGALLRTADGGQSWTTVSSGVSADLESVCFTSQSDGWAVGKAGTVLHTTSGGL